MMATEKDLLDKADALLRRHSLGPGNETGTYPVLTDLVVPPELRQPDEVTPEPSAEAPSDVRDELAGRVLAQLRTTLGVELERQVAETLAPQLRAAVKEALGSLEQRLAGMVADAVAKALEERGPVK